jgi:hypothetical protein
VPFCDIIIHARPGGVIGVWLAAGGPPPVPHLLLGAAGRGPRRAALLVCADLGALIRRVPAVLVSAEGCLRLVPSRHLAAARRLDIGDGPGAPRVPLAGTSPEAVLADACSHGLAGSGSRVRYSFDSPPDALLG